MRLPLALFGLFAASPALAQLRPVPVQPASEEAALRGVEVYLMNEGDAPLEAEGPQQIEVTALDGTRLVLERVPGARPSVAPGGFAKVRYVPVAVTPPVPPPRPPRAPALPGMTLADEGETVVPSNTPAATTAGFLDRFRPHEPIYGAFGLNDAGGKLQFSAAFQPFAGDGVASHLRLAYTQTMFWAINEPSGPFRSTIYSPEVFVDAPIGDSASLTVGYRHDSNGGGDTDSVDSNRIYARITKRFDLGGGWEASVAPQAWFYVGALSRQARLADYWGYTGIGAAIGQKDGVKVALTARGSFETGRAAGELFASYPMTRLGGLGIYLFGQAFTGYGESLDTLRTRESRARLGIAFTR